MKTIRKQDLICLGDWNQKYRIPGIVATEKGTLLCYFENRDPEGLDWSVSDIGMMRSTDSGNTWEQMRVIATGHDKNTSNNPVMIADGDTVHFVWQENYKRAFYSCSTDEGVTWSEPREITDAFEAVRGMYPWTVIATGPGHGIRLKNGRLLIPVWLASNRASITAHNPSVSATLYSDDRGATWQMGELIRSAMVKDPSEADVAQLADGRVVINLRNNTNVHLRAYAFSEDGGAHFGKLQYDETLIDPGCDAGIASSGGRVWFSNCASSTSARCHLTVRMSEDGCQSWKESLYIEELAGYSDLAYCACTKKLFLFYEHNDNAVLRLAEIQV